MEFPKRIYAVGTADDDIQVGSRFEALPGGLLEDGAEVGIYGLLRVKRVQVTRKLVAPDEPEPSLTFDELADSLREEREEREARAVGQ